jgi:hypothetical protein
MKLLMRKEVLAQIWGLATGVGAQAGSKVRRTGEPGSRLTRSSTASLSHALHLHFFFPIHPMFHPIPFSTPWLSHSYDSVSPAPVAFISRVVETVFQSYLVFSTSRHMYIHS